LSLNFLLIGHWLHLLPGDAHAERFLMHTLDAKGYQPVVVSAIHRRLARVRIYQLADILASANCRPLV
jgi:hypothetical protein